MEPCLPEQMTCIMSQKKPWTDTSCPNACNGLFANVHIKKDLNASSDFNLIAGEYLKYKKNYVQNIEFNSSLDSTSFRKLKYYKYLLYQYFFQLQCKTMATLDWSWCRSTSTRPCTTRSRRTKKPPSRLKSLFLEAPLDSSQGFLFLVPSRLSTTFSSSFCPSSESLKTLVSSSFNECYTLHKFLLN